MPVGFEIYTEIPRPPESLIASFQDVPVPDLIDVMFKRGAVSTRIRPAYLPMPKIVGPAVTVSVPDVAFDVFKVALEMTKPGDVVVINARGNVDHALLGGNVCRGLKARGLAGLLIDGAVRDVSEIRHDQFPVFARGVALKMGPLQGAGEINVPIAFGNVVVNPGDIIVADEDGIAVVPPDRATEVLALAQDLGRKHAAAQPALLRGEIVGIDAILSRVRSSGAEFHERAHRATGGAGE